MMDSELAKELQQATDELLDLGPLQPPSRYAPSSPHLQTPQQARATRQDAAQKSTTFSSSSKLEIIHSPTDVRPFHWPAPISNHTDGTAQDSPSLAAKAGIGAGDPINIVLVQSVSDDADDHLPERGLSSRMSSVKAVTGKTLEEEHQQPVDLFGRNGEETSAASPSKLKLRTPIFDIYINQYGERVVQGKVVGRILGGRPRPASRCEHASQPSSSFDQAASSSIALPASPPKSTSTQTTSSKDATSPPVFFLESFPDAFSSSRATTPSSTSVRPNRERRPSKGGPPSILKAPRAVAGALTLAHSDNVDGAVPVMVRDASLHTASYFDSPGSSSSKQLSPRPHAAGLSSASFYSTKDAYEEIASSLKGLELDSVDSEREDQEDKDLLSPSEAVLTAGGRPNARSKLELPTLRQPTPTVELSQERVETVLHGNRRQARASGVAQPESEASSHNRDSRYDFAVVSPLKHVKALHSMHGVVDVGNTDHAIPQESRFGSFSEPNSPVLSSRLSRFPQHDEDEALFSAKTRKKDDDDDKASLESAPSSLISLPVSSLTSSSRTPSHTSLERRRSASSTHSRRRSSLNNPHYSTSSDVFAREVKIRGWSEVGSNARGWVVYELRILTKQGTPIIALKRFSSFVKLRESLKRECGEQAKWLPELPSKSAGLLSKYDANYLEKRRRALQRWLELVVLDRVWGASEAVREWVLASD
ncbi:uncharacterized protein MEPE_04987 [Melanopsichium pennsylvanicum]|uniref:Endosomal/vacuolar adapter protein YPT35 n=2 Tax=Melanopsichium pennsylvanicum TaxID=63383 RepID=A0AAJ5C780_9BASI|nr:putative protein [Melanopsichium pennsylvanicum 4]SNX86278.1 uncharacterized protein MEPE_04987 [Melanopsichium pennsylvanicum]